jgi:hypothetical protein
VLCNFQIRLVLVCLVAVCGNVAAAPTSLADAFSTDMYLLEPSPEFVEQSAFYKTLDRSRRACCDWYVVVFVEAVVHTFQMLLYNCTHQGTPGPM